MDTIFRERLATRFHAGGESHVPSGIDFGTLIVSNGGGDGKYGNIGGERCCSASERGN